MECGVRCVGKYACAGPLVAAAVIWGSHVDEQKLIDYDKLSTNKLLELSVYVKENAIDWSVAFLDIGEIDQRNIMNASTKVMNMALEKMRVDFDRVVAREFFDCDAGEIEVCEDGRHLGLCAASILAKCARNEHMRVLGMQEQYKIYNWEKNMGYGTPNHKSAIDIFGICDHHRASFGLGHI